MFKTREILWGFTRFSVWIVKHFIQSMSKIAIEAKFNFNKLVKLKTMEFKDVLKVKQVDTK